MSHPIPNSLNVSSLKALNETLAIFNLDSSTWVKTPESLFEEIEKKESVLEVRLHRKVEVVCVRCFQKNKQNETFQLIELKQVFKDGTVRIRDFKYVSEKMMPGETPQQAAIRALAEELQISGPELKIEALSSENTFKTNDSPSYKGIFSSYNLYYFKTEIPDHM